MRSLWRSLALALTLPGPALAEPLFLDARDRLGPPMPGDFTMDIAQGDVNGDGAVDLVFALEFAPNRLLLGDGRGGFFEAPRGWAPAEAHDSEDAALGDLDGDGDLDLVVVSEDDRIDEYLVNDGTGRFVPAPAPLPVAEISNALVMADMDGDGDLDLVIGNRGPNRLLINDGAGGFAVDARFPAGGDTTQDIAQGDVTGDGLADLVVANEGQSRILVALGGGRFADRTATLLTGVPPGETRDASLADVDGDGDLDLYLANVRLFSGLDPQDRLLINDGTGRFADETARRLPADPGSTMDAAFADFDGDGDADLLLAQFGDITGRSWATPMRALLNDGEGRYVDATAAVLPPTATANGMHIEPLEGTGALVVASRGGPELLLVPAP